MRSTRSRLWLSVAAVLAGGSLALLPQLSGCNTTGSRATARVVTARDQLVGGQRALGDVGDLVLSNGRIRAVVQGKSSSRGFGVFGGSLIDLDLERPRLDADGRPVGGDGLSEIFPAFFLRGLEPDSVEVLEDGSGEDGKAIVSVKGKGGEFLSMVAGINGLLLPDTFRFEVRYQLDPVPDDASPEEGRSLLMTVTATNGGKTPISLSTDALPVGFGLVTLMGGGQDLFLPGDAGWDMRYALERAYAHPPPLPGIPGVYSRAMVSSGARVSYAFAPVASKTNFLYNLRDKGFPDATQDSLIIPFVVSSFTGLFVHRPPALLEPGKATSFSVRIYVGTGDVASALDLAMAARNDPYGTLTGMVREAGTGTPLSDVKITVQDPKTGRAVTSCRPLRDGRFHARVPPGRYIAAVVGNDRDTFRSEPFEVSKDETVYQDLSIERPAYLAVNVFDAEGRPLPAKVTLVGRYSGKQAGKLTRDFLFDLRVGEPYLYSDLVADNAAKPETLEYQARVLVTDATGRAQGAVRPGTYRIVASRGTEYSLAEEAAVTLAPGEARQLSFTLTREVDTGPWVSGDFHVHSINSIDSSITLLDRARAYAAEGVGYLAMTDHNYVTDLTPEIERAGLSDWVRASPGLELTTLEMGHFNSYPLRYQPGPVTHGSFDWFRVAPGTLFERLRGIGSLPPEETVVQINHPRDTIMGYFNAFNLDEEGTPRAVDGMLAPNGPEFLPSAFSDAFDAVEVMNGKRIDLVHTYRVPNPLPPPPLPAVVPPTGTVVRRPADGRVAFPGNFEDWFAFLRKNKVITGTANSDSHGGIDEEAGFPRTYVKLDSAPRSARELDEREISRAIRSQRALMTNGPFVEFWINGVGVGDLVTARDGQATFHIRVRAPSWMDVKSIKLIRSDLTEENVPFTAVDKVLRADVGFFKSIPKDDFFVVEVQGQRGMWPVVAPREVPTLLINDAVGSIGSAFGIGDDGLGNLRPNEIGPLVPFALTNPIWVDVDGDGVSFGKGRRTQALTREPDVAAPPSPARPVGWLRMLGNFGR